MKIYPEFYLGKTYANLSKDAIERKLTFKTNVRVKRGETYYLVSCNYTNSYGVLRKSLENYNFECDNKLIANENEFLERCLTQVQNMQRYYLVPAYPVSGVIVDPNQEPDSFEKAMQKEGFKTVVKWSKKLLLIS